MSEFVFHPEAAKDLEDIWEYIAADSLEAADRVREEIYDAIQSLVPFPYVGHCPATSRRGFYAFRSPRVCDRVCAGGEAARDRRHPARRSPRVIAAMLQGRK